MAMAVEDLAAATDAAATAAVAVVEAAAAPEDAKPADRPFAPATQVRRSDGPSPSGVTQFAPATRVRTVTRMRWLAWLAA
jgi:hypothetical protein